MEIHIKTALQELLAAIERRDAAQSAAKIEQLDELLARGRGALAPQLVHFLQNRSYAKALMLLGGVQDIPVGLCGGRGRAR